MSDSAFPIHLLPYLDRINTATKRHQVESAVADAERDPEISADDLGMIDEAARWARWHLPALRSWSLAFDRSAPTRLLVAFGTRFPNRGEA